MPKEKDKPKLNKQIYDLLTKRFSGFIVLIIIIVFSSFYIFLIDPKLQTAIIEIQDSIGWQKNILLIQRQKLAEMEKNLDFYRQVRAEDINLIESIIPNQYPKEKLFGKIEDIVLQNGFILSSMNMAKINQSEEGDGENSISDNITNNLQIIEISLSINGIDYSALKSFLARLERQLPLMNIVSLDFSPQGESLSFVINTYYFKP